MLAAYGTGRGTLREALRLLEFQGVIELKPGPGGGPILTAPAASHLAGALQLLMQLNQAPYRVVVEARSALEPVVSQLAAERIGAGGRAELAETVTHGSLEAFHEVIAWSSGNVLLAYVMTALLSILDGTVIGIDSDRAAARTAHEEIYEAISRRDGDAAAARMREHTEASARHARRKFPEILDRTITWDRLLT
jgi:DNA-binding FadR family transcriptional regulator